MVPSSRRAHTRHLQPFEFDLTGLLNLPTDAPLGPLEPAVAAGGSNLTLPSFGGSLASGDQAAGGAASTRPMSAVQADYLAWSAKKASEETPRQRARAELNYARNGTRTVYGAAQPEQLIRETLPGATYRLGGTRHWCAAALVYRTLSRGRAMAVLRTVVPTLALAVGPLPPPQDVLVRSVGCETAQCRAEAGTQTAGAASVQGRTAKRTGGRQRKHFRQQRWKLEGHFPCNDWLVLECWDEHGNLVDCGRTEYLHSPYCRHLRCTNDGLPHAGAVDGGSSWPDCSRWERSATAARSPTASGEGG